MNLFNKISSHVKLPKEVKIPTNKQNTLYFDDGVSKIDAILVHYKNQGENELNTFLENLKQIGVKINFSYLESDPNLIFIKIHTPAPVLEKYADKYDIVFRKDRKIKFPPIRLTFAFLENILNSPFPNPNHPVCKRAWKTISKEIPTEIESCERSVVLFLIMDYIPFGNRIYDVGLRQLMDNNIISDAYPLHDGPWEWSDDPNEPLNDRQLLAEYWANFEMIHKQQPLNLIKDYYGYEIAMYFAWLGCYIYMLIFAAAIGLLTFIYGLFTTLLIDKYEIHKFCDYEGKMCNDHLIDTIRRTEVLEPISSTCPYIYTTFINSNLGTFIYSIIIVFWCTIFKEKWKRKFSVLNAKWGNPNNEDFILRPQYTAAAVKTRLHKYSGKPEKYIPFCNKFIRYIISTMGTILLVALPFGSLVSIIYLEFYLTDQYYSRIVIIFITSFLSLLSMIILELLCNNDLLKLLVRIEIQATQLDYEKSLIVKSFIFLFCNSYMRLIYIAFIKGKLITIKSYLLPEKNIGFNNFFPIEHCMPPSCVFEVICLLIIILVFKPLLLNLIEILKTHIYTVFKQVKLNLSDLKTRPRWESDYALTSLDRRYILTELNKLIIQFGFVTFFAASCPLAPLIALIYNLVSIRLDATKIVKFYKRPVGRKRETSIGICFDLFETMVFVAIVINSLYMAYTCKFVHELFHFDEKGNEIEDPIKKYEYSEILFEYPKEKIRDLACFVPGLYEKPTTTSNKFYILTVAHYDLLKYKANLALVIMLLGIIYSGIISYVIPDVPRDLLEFIHYHEEKEKEKYL